MIFQIGFRKCGTTALSNFFNRCGIPSVHWDKGNLARKMRANIEAGRPIMDGYTNRFEAFTDMEVNQADDFFEGFKHFRRMMTDYPHAKFVFNTRDEKRWLRSMRRWAWRSRHMDYVKIRYGSYNLWRFSACLRREWKQHYDAVTSTIPADRLLVFDIESDPPEKLCRFCNIPESKASRFVPEYASKSTWSYTFDKVWRPFKRMLYVSKRTLVRPFGRLGDRYLSLTRPGKR